MNKNLGKDCGEGERKKFNRQEEKFLGHFREVRKFDSLHKYVLGKYPLEGMKNFDSNRGRMAMLVGNMDPGKVETKRKLFFRDKTVFYDGKDIGEYFIRNSDKPKGSPRYKRSQAGPEPGDGRLVGSVEKFFKKKEL